MALGAADAYFQDLEYFVMFLLQLFFYGSPIVYSIDQFSSAHLVVQLIRINPMTILINAYRDCFLYHQIPDFTALGLTALFSFAVLVIGYWIFRKLERGFAEQL
jgi:ABC-type polysaccharide/polyol phosphate export permease